MTSLTEYTSYEDSQSEFSIKGLWQLLDGDKQQLNIAHEAVDRHAHQDKMAIHVAHSDGTDESISFNDLSSTSSQLANWLCSLGVKTGDRVGVMVDPSLAFYAAMFGIIKAGAVAVPMFTLFGIDLSLIHI